MAQLVRRDPHERHAPLVQRLDERRGLAERRRDHEPVDMRLVHEAEHFANELVATAGAALMRKGLEALLTAAGHGSVLNIDDVVGARVSVHQPDEVRTPARETAAERRGDS